MAESPADALVQPTVVRGVLHFYVAFDWGDEIRLDQVRQLVLARAQELPRRRRTPPSFFYRPPPAHVVLAPALLQLPELGEVQAGTGVTLFDFGAVSVAFRIPFELPPSALLRLAESLAESGPLVQKARAVVQPLHQQLQSAIHDPAWSEDLSEEYTVFQLAPDVVPRSTDPAWLAGLVHLESAPLSTEEVNEALRYRLSYSPEDLFIPDWAAAVLIDRDCDETLQAIEFANLQLLEYRHIDNRLDESLAEAGRTIAPPARSLPLWRITARPLNLLGVLKVEAEGLFERTANVLKLIGDPYLGRVYRLLSARFYLEAWMENIQRKLEVAEGIYQVVSDQASSFRLEFLEIVVVVLILIEVVMAFFRH
jgi:hypothetical protein